MDRRYWGRESWYEDEWDATEEPPYRPAKAPGKRTLTMGLPPRPGRSPVQGSKSPAKRASAAPAAQHAAGQSVWRQGRGTIDPEHARTVLDEVEGASTGAMLDAALRGTVEPGFGRSFADVRVHTDGAANQAAQALNAKAFTVGNQVYFDRGQYAPESEQGRHLLAHELAHVAQGSTAAARGHGAVTVSRPDDPAELAADRAADAVLRGERVGHVGSAPASVIHRYPGEVEGRALSHQQWLAQHKDELCRDLGRHLGELAEGLALPSPFARWAGTPRVFADALISVFEAGDLWHQLNRLLTHSAVDHAMTRGRDMEHVQSTDITGSPDYNPNVALELRGPLGRALSRSLRRVLPRYLMARNQATLALENREGACVMAAPEPDPADIIASHPMDRAVIDALATGVVEFDFLSYRDAKPNEQSEHELPERQAVTFEWVQPRPGVPMEPMTGWIRVTSPAAARAEDVARELFGDETLATNLSVAAPLFGFMTSDLVPTHRQAWLRACGIDGSAYHQDEELAQGEAHELGNLPIFDAFDTPLGEGIMLAQSRGLPETADASKKTIVDRLDVCITLLDGIDQDLQSVEIRHGGVAAARDQLQSRMAKLASGDSAEAMQWNAQSLAQMGILRQTASGAKFVVEQFARFGYVAGKSKLPEPAERALRDWAIEYGRAAAMSGLPETASEYLRAAAERSRTFPIEMMESILVYCRDALREAARHQYEPIDHARLEAMEASLRERLMKARDDIFQNPERVQEMLQSMFEEVNTLQNLATITATIGTITELIDAMELSFWGVITGKNERYLGQTEKLREWRLKWYEAYLYYSEDVLRPGKGEALLRECLDSMDEVRAVIQETAQLIQEEEELEQYLQLGTRLVAAVAIIAVTMGVGSYVSGGLMIGAGWGATTGGVIAAGTLTAGAEALTFTTLSTLILEENPSFGGFVSNFFENWALFGAMRTIALGAELAAVRTELAAAERFGEAGARLGKLGGVGIKGIGHGINVVGLFAYHLHEAEKESREKRGRGLTSEERQQIVMEGFAVLLGDILVARYGGPFLAELRGQGADSSWAAKLGEITPRRAELARLAESMKAAQDIDAKTAEKLIQEALAADAALLRDQAALLREIAAWADANPAKARLMGIGAEAMTAKAAELDTAYAANERTQLTRELEPQGGDLFVYRGAELDALIRRFEALGDKIEWSQSANGRRIATVTPRDGAALRIQEVPDFEVRLSDNARRVLEDVPQGERAEILSLINQSPERGAEILEAYYLKCIKNRPKYIAKYGAEPPTVRAFVAESMGNLDTVLTRGYPYGFESKVQFEQFGRKIKSFLQDQGYPVDDIRIQGSAVINKTPGDIDVGVMVSSEKFAEIIKQSFKSPTPGSSKEKTMLHALSEGKITAGNCRPKLSSLRRELQALLNGKKVDISIILRGGNFDVRPTMNIP